MKLLNIPICPKELKEHIINVGFLNTKMNWES